MQKYLDRHEQYSRKVFIEKVPFLILNKLKILDSQAYF